MSTEYTINQINFISFHLAQYHHHQLHNHHRDERVHKLFFSTSGTLIPLCNITAIYACIDVAIYIDVLIVEINSPVN